ncbi:hypothetical protein BJF79_46655 [Actinomadura sp. CNU-125]|uniref:iron-containing redox enzyme family protein n=1 Tax=Actinomadura sp. CNU-125 TaxID=1904961 RepID=UPI000960B050|nr:iron-containing redox enzyme family protein [Actinomadura sp. CNU-125]OLT21725.1 hypothetical protein BJF79_46655 [Actinomadura sp. CNU-125]
MAVEHSAPPGPIRLRTRGRDAAPVLPQPRGPLSHAVIDALAGRPPAGAAPATAGDAASADPYGDDLQLALHVCYELHYRGFSGVAPDWEWDPELLRLRGALETVFLDALRTDTGSTRPDAPDPRDAAGARRPGGRGHGRPPEPAAQRPAGEPVPPENDGGARAELENVLDGLLVEPADDGTGVAGHLRDAGQWWQLLEHAAHRSVYHLKEADPHAFVIPRLRGRAKTALVAVEHDEYGGGRPDRIHAGLYADLLEDLGLDPSYGAYVDAAPAPMLATVNMMSCFGLRRSLRGALVGHFAAAEITTAPAARRMVRALDRLGAGPRARLFYTEHIEADAVHEQVLRHDVIGGLLADEPELAADVTFGVRATGLLEDRLAAHLLGAWRARPPRTSLRRPLTAAPPRG